MANYALPYTGSEVAAMLGSIPTRLSELSQDSTHRTVTDEEKALWNQGGGGGSVPTPTTADNGKFLRVVNGSAAWVTLETMAGGSY